MHDDTLLEESMLCGDKCGKGVCEPLVIHDDELFCRFKWCNRTQLGKNQRICIELIWGKKTPKIM